MSGTNRKSCFVSTKETPSETGETLGKPEAVANNVNAVLQKSRNIKLVTKWITLTNVMRGDWKPKAVPHVQAMECGLIELFDVLYGEPPPPAPVAAQVSEEWKPISSGGLSLEPHDICSNGKEVLGVGFSKRDATVICDAHNSVSASLRARIVELEQTQKKMRIALEMQARKTAYYNGQDPDQMFRRSAMETEKPMWCHYLCEEAVSALELK